MIINGEYVFIDFDSLKPMLIEAFSKYYGEEYREEIKKRIDKIVYKPFHTIDYVCEYYNEYLSKFQKEISDRFFELLDSPRTSKKEKLIMAKGADFQPEIFVAISGGRDIDNCTTITAEGRAYIKSLREKIKKAFDLQGSDDEVFHQILDLYNTYVIAETDIEKIHICDVSHDITTLQNNSVEALKRFMREIKDDGYDIPFEDIAMVCSDDFSPNQVPYLKIFNIVMGDELLEKGIISYFTTESNDLLKNGRIDQKVDIVTNRLKYLTMFGAEFKYIDREELYNPTDSKDWVTRLFREYEYQKTMPKEITYTDYFNYNSKEVRENYTRGEFFPSDLADKIEECRKRNADTIYDNCKFFANRNREYTLDEYEFYTTYEFNNRDIFDPYSIIYINEDGVYSEADLLRIIIHEVNHAICHGGPHSLDNKRETFTFKTGMSYITKPKDTDNVLSFDNASPLYYNNDLLTLEENINERQSREIYDILRSLYKIDLGYKKDVIYKPTKERYSCAYDMYDFLTEEFFQRYKEEICRHKIDTSYNMYFRHELSMDRTHRILDFVRDKFRRRFDKSYAEEGVVDFYKVEKLARIVSDFYNNIFPLIERKESALGRKITLRELEPALYKRIMELIEEKNKIIEEMLEDEKRIIKVEQPQEQIQEEQELNN